MQDKQEPKKERRHEGIRQAMQAFSFLGGIGIYFVVVVGICIYLGSLADEYIGRGSYGKLAGILSGFPIGLYCVYKEMKRKM
jgi:F0F1-type ATP synthase assembly protein I